MHEVAVLFVRDDSDYKTFYNVDAYDRQRDATTYGGLLPIVAHPPCRAWGVLSHMAKPREGEKELADFALAVVRKNGGCLEHPAGSRLFKKYGIPDANQGVDAFGGYTVLINQFDFGHVASKPTKIYVCGLPFADLPQMPPKKNPREAKKSITGQVGNTARCTQYEREYTPIALEYWLIEIARLAKKMKGTPC